MPSENKTLVFRHIDDYREGESCVLCDIHPSGAVEEWHICLKSTHTECDAGVCTYLKGLVKRAYMIHGIIVIEWGTSGRSDTWISELGDYSSSDIDEPHLPLETLFCARKHHGACHTSTCGHPEDPVESITHENDYIVVLYKTGRRETHPYTTVETPYDAALLNHPPRLTETISYGDLLSTICKVCGRKIQGFIRGQSSSFRANLHLGTVCEEVHHYALASGI